MNSTNTVKTSRRTLIAILAVSILPVAGAWFVFFTGIGMPDKTVNAGQLLSSPVYFKDLLGGSNPDWLNLDQHRAWRLLIPITEKCEQACQKNLYTTRQVHIRLGEKSSRVKRVAINLAGEAGNRFYESLKREHPRLMKLDIDIQSWRQWLLASGQQLDNNQTPYYLLMDQEGHVMMFYTAEQQGNELLKDLKRALKFSIDYQ